VGPGLEHLEFRGVSPDFQLIFCCFPWVLVISSLFCIDHRVEFRVYLLVSKWCVVVSGGGLPKSVCVYLLSVRACVEPEAGERDKVGCISLILCLSFGERCLLWSVDGENIDLMSLVFVVVCDAQSWRTCLMLASRLLLRLGVVLGCERSFLVRFGCVPCVVSVGFGLRLGAVPFFGLVVLLLLFIVVALPRDVLLAMNCCVSGAV